MAATGRRVLVVDDAWWATELVGRLLERAGYDVHAAHDGDAALGLVERQAPDVILADVRMPGLDGPGLARRLRDGGHRIPVVLMSADPVAPPLADLPGVRFIPKPFEPAGLVAAVEAALAGRE